LRAPGHVLGERACCPWGRGVSDGGIEGVPSAFVDALDQRRLDQRVQRLIRARVTLMSSPVAQWIEQRFLDRHPFGVDLDTFRFLDGTNIEAVYHGPAIRSAESIVVIPGDN
jgi:hypothetical protein